MPRALGRIKPPDYDHVLKYPAQVEHLVGLPTPVVLGINWYEGFDNPVQGTDKKWRIKISGEVRGGHCICVEPASPSDRTSWHTFYDQGEEGACEGFGHSRAMSLLTGRTYNGFWLYDDARRKEGTYNEGDVGATNRGTCAALKSWGDHYQDGEHCVRTKWATNVPGTGIKSYRWATHTNEVLQALSLTNVNEVALLNSWGTEYPQRVYLSTSNLQRLLTEEGEASILVR